MIFCRTLHLFYTIWNCLSPTLNGVSIPQTQKSYFLLTLFGMWKFCRFFPNFYSTESTNRFSRLLIISLSPFTWNISAIWICFYVLFDQIPFTISDSSVMKYSIHVHLYTPYLQKAIITEFPSLVLGICILWTLPPILKFQFQLVLQLNKSKLRGERSFPSSKKIRKLY